MSEQLLENCVDGTAMNILPGPGEHFFLAALEACKPGKRFANAACSSHHKLACKFMREQPPRKSLTHVPPAYPHTQPPAHGPNSYYPHPLTIPSHVYIHLDVENQGTQRHTRVHEAH